MSLLNQMNNKSNAPISDLRFHHLYRLYMDSGPVRPKKKLLYFRQPNQPCFSCRPCNFYCLPEINKKIFIPTDPKMFHKIGQKNLKKVRIAKLILRIIFFNFLDVLNFIICMFSGTVDDV